MPGLSLAAQLLQAHDQERRRLARALHNTAAQQIAALQFNLSMVAPFAENLPRRAARALSESADLATACALEIRNISYSLYPPLLDEVGLVAALRVAADAAKVELMVLDSVGRLPSEMEIALFRIVEEVLPRISRVAVKRTAQARTLEFDLRAASPAIRERVRSLKGRIAAKSGLQRITVPLRSQGRRS